MSIRLSSVSKSFGAHPAVDGISAEIESGTFFVVLGPSGCGKSTLLRCIAGLEPIDDGEIALGDDVVANGRVFVPPEARDVGVVFQSYALWPHLSVSKNVSFPLETARLSKDAIAAKTKACLETVELMPFKDRRPADLSGGQRQRVALARCLAQSAGTILMDEPLANLDPHLRSAMEEELGDFHRTSGSTTVFITHDQREAMALADKIALMWDGRFLQVDAPDVLYARPETEEVARFIGRSTIVDVEVTGRANGSCRVRLGEAGFDVAGRTTTAGQKARLVIRPEHLTPCPPSDGFSARVTRATYRGGYWETHLAAEGLEDELLINLPGKAAPGDAMGVRLTDGWLLPG